MGVNIFPIHFSPFIRHHDATFKYGVVQSKQLFKDLESWRWLTLAGRMHKPILEVENNLKQLDRQRYSQAYSHNLQAAVAVAILLDLKPVYPLDELLYTVMSLSYYGDIRVTMGGEN